MAIKEDESGKCGWKWMTVNRRLQKLTKINEHGWKLIEVDGRGLNWMNVDESWWNDIGLRLRKVYKSW